MKPEEGEQVRCPKCNTLMGKQKRFRHYWKCRRAILKDNGDFNEMD